MVTLQGLVWGIQPHGYAIFHTYSSNQTKIIISVSYLAWRIMSEYSSFPMVLCWENVPLLVAPRITKFHVSCGTLITIFLCFGAPTIPQGSTHWTHWTHTPNPPSPQFCPNFPMAKNSPSPRHSPPIIKALSHWPTNASFDPLFLQCTKKSG